MAITLKSKAFSSGQPIPRKFTGDGADVSPPLSWEGIPEGTKQLALICDDPDAPRKEPWVHWVIYGIPPAVSALPEAVDVSLEPASLPGVLQGKNDFGRVGYGGPAPPRGHGVHCYSFRLYALDTQLMLKPGLDKAALLQAIRGHVLGEGELIGTYQR